MEGTFELVLGGLIYMLGVVFFKSDGIIPCAHAIWHLFVVAGSSFHLYAVHTYLIGNNISGIEGGINGTGIVHRFGENV